MQQDALAFSRREAADALRISLRMLVRLLAQRKLSGAQSADGLSFQEPKS